MPGKTLPFPTIAQKIETLAQEPTARLFSTVRLANGSTKDISYRKFLSIVNKAALWLDANLPKPESADDFPTFQYVGNLNLRLLALVVAAEKTGRKILMVRRYAPQKVRTHLAAKTECSTFLYEDSVDLVNRARDSPILSGNESHILLPCWEYWFSSSKVTVSSSDTDWNRTLDNPLCVFHTSGTTGTPKPITWTNRRISQYASMGYMANGMGVPGSRMVFSFPLHHVGGLMLALLWPVYLGSIAVLQERDVPNSPEEAFALMQDSNATLLAAQPSLLSSMLKSQQITSRMRQLSLIVTGSAPMGIREINQIQQNGGPQVYNLYGATETLPLRQSLSDRGDWPYISFKSDSGVSFCHETGDLYELVIHKGTDNTHQLAVFYTFSDVEIFRSKDLFTPHPQKLGLWRFSCRSDDMVNLAHGQGVNVGPMEEILSECALVDTVLIGQQGRPSTVLLIVPYVQPMNNEEIRDELWPYVDRANRVCHSAAEIGRDMILILPPRQWLSSITDKGSVNRHGVFKEFSVEIDVIFAAAAAAETKTG